MDIFDDDPAREAIAWRAQAEESLKHFQFPESIRLERYAYYLSIAEAFEAMARGACSTNNKDMPA
ncbi:hypothetical protein [Stenotrophomonas maltophilia]|uniref:hypothetical protein n=1 Tax=Stenotrophomonas maltophilia TaxID=40324 RepID=UPI00066AB533|nr:hypothetical protein [Stenotrophomonas maltophilia]ELK2666197.1 hypothetical protein [Stenotrophomonas maltophilia]KUJ01710.1 hypothetical protein AR275_25745 [Stenotrophomonas maltophilia]MBH1377771.1 hypothetical protein [Stenotrophomonas maltophilia]MBH1440459.1 hypothetical protein [Stenotrophomonas maltophilia]MBH1559077.1 hypothetical protein [Stenotrophomonas maltophilia]